MLKSKLNLRKAAILIACLAVTTMFASCGETNGNNGNGSKGTFKLKIYQGYDFQNKRVVDYGSNKDLADIIFYVMYTNPSDAKTMRVYLEASKINYFENPPTHLTAEQVNEWNYYILAPSKLYYVVRARDGRYYLLHLLNQENYDAIMPWTTTPANWVFTFDWKEITVK